MNKTSSILVVFFIIFISACNNLYTLEDEYKNYKWTIPDDIPRDVLVLFEKEGKGGENTIWYYKSELGYRSYNYYSLKDQCGTVDTLYQLRENEWYVGYQIIAFC